MTNREILRIAMEQSAIDINCKATVWAESMLYGRVLSAGSEPDETVALQLSVADSHTKGFYRFIQA